jgi:hypothetical protein
LCLLWSSSVLATSLLDREVFVRMLGVGAARITNDDGIAFSAQDIASVWTRPDVLPACERRAIALVGAARSVPVRIIATTPAYFQHRESQLFDGRALTWADTRAAQPRVVVGPALATLLTRTRGPLTIEGYKATPVGALRAREGSGNEFLVIRVLPPGELDAACGADAERSLAILAVPDQLQPTLGSVRVSLWHGAGLIASQARLVSEASPRIIGLWSRSRRSARIALYGASMVIVVISAVTLATLTEVRNRGRQLELGMARILGASRRDLVVELVGEAFGLTTVALVLGLLPAVALVGTMGHVLSVPIPLARIGAGCTAILVIVMALSSAGAIRRAVVEAPIHTLGQ